MKRKDPLKNLTNQTRANVSFLMMSSPNGTISSNVALNRRKLRKLFFTHYIKNPCRVYKMQSRVYGKPCRIRTLVCLWGFFALPLAEG